VPERRAFRYALIDAQALPAAPTDAEIEAYYKANLKRFGGVEVRSLQQVVLPDAKAAQALADAVKGGAPFADAAAKAGFAAADIAIGEVTEADFAGQTNAGVARAAFAAPPGGITAPVQGPLGWHVVRAAAVTPARAVPLATARAAILPVLEAEKREKLLADKVAAIEDRLADGEPLGEVAAANGLVLSEVPPMTADGQLLDPTNMLVPAADPLAGAMVSRAFATDPADGAGIVEPVKGQFALLEVTEVVPPAPIPLAAIRPRVLEAYVADAREKAAKAKAEAIAKSGEDLAKAAATGGLPPPQRLTVRRLELTQMAASGQPIPPPVLLLLNVPVGQSRVASVPGGQGWFVVRTEAAAKGDASAIPQLVEQVRSGMAQAAGNEMAETFARAVQRSVGTVRQPAAIAAVKRKLTGAGAEAGSDTGGGAADGGQ
jgi:peptidyl-prolyl cis-trans isomerase D